MENKIITTLKLWNDAYPEYFGMIFLRIYDDESGTLVYYIYEDKEEIFSFHNLEEWYAKNPKQYRLEQET